MDNSYSSTEPRPELMIYEELIPLTPHQYPKRILYFFGFFVLLFLYSLTELPQQVSAMINAKQGESRLAAGRYEEAAALFGEASQKTQSVEVRKNRVVACLRMKTTASVQTALAELAFLKLNEQQTQQVKDAMPSAEELRRLLSASPVRNLSPQN